MERYLQYIDICGRQLTDFYVNHTIKSYLFMLEIIFGLTKTLPDHLQAIDLELESDNDLVCSVIHTLSERISLII